VTDRKNRIQGVVFLDDIRNVMFESRLYSVMIVSEKMKPVPEVIRIDEPMESVIAKFEHTGAWNLPVVNEMGEYVGFLSKSKIFSSYRNLLKELFSD
jgi:CIC family chloride channel protein